MNTNRIRSIVVLISVGLMLPGLLLAENLAGRVLDPQGNRVANAELKLFDRRSGELRTTIATAEGEYVFQGIPAGDYLLQAEASSAALLASQEVSVRGDVNLDVNLAISSNNVEVIVTASGTPLSVMEIAKAVDVVTSDQIALRNEFSITEAIRNLPGVRVQTLEGPGSFTTIETRGLRAQDTAVLIDGMRFRDAGSPAGDATAFLEDMMTVDTERIEFLRGSGSSLYGSNALGGVLNISSRPGGGKTHGDFRTEGGGLGMIRSVIGAGGGISQDRFTYSGTVSHLNITKGVRNGMPYRNTSAQGSAKYSFTPEISISGRMWIADAYLTSTNSPTFTPAILANLPAAGIIRAIALPTSELEKFERGQPFNPGNATFIPNTIDPDGRRVSSFLNGSATFQHQLSPGGTYRISYQGLDTNRAFVDAAGGPPSTNEPLYPNRSQFDGRTDTVKVHMDQQAGDHNLIAFGYEFEREQYFSMSTDQSPNPPTNSTTLQQHSHALYAQDQIRLMGGQLQLTLAARTQIYSLPTPVFSGNIPSPYEGISVDSPNAYTGDVSLAYLFRGTQTKLRSHVGNSYRSPSPFERFGGSFSSQLRTFSYRGDPRLRPERAIALDAGIDQYLFGSKLQMSGSIFYTNLQETILSVSTLPADDIFGRLSGYRNSGGGIARGAELSGQVSPTSSTNVQVSYTYTNSESRTPTIAGTNFYTRLGLSPHVFSVTATQWIARRFNVTLDLSAASDYPLSLFGATGRQFTFEGPIKADIVSRYDLPLDLDRTIEFYGKVENVFARRYYEDGFLGPGAWAIGGLRLRF